MRWVNLTFLVSYLPFRISGIALWPFVFILKGLNNPRLLNHERIHLQQQLELAILFFYLIYIGNYLVNLIKYTNHQQAYRHIIFEQECYAHEHDLNYLSVRKPYQCFRQKK
ncbi:MAG: hypothetical protein RIQ89_768 [Bacteroidota bacterium]|jgi:hypothetical protein